MSTPVVSYRHDPALFINYTGDDPEYYPDEGSMVVRELQSARVDAHDLDALELSSGGKLVVTTHGDQKTLEIRALGIADPSIVDTTVVDSGPLALQLASESGVSFASETVSFEAETEIRSHIAVADESHPTFHHVATANGMLVGTGILDDTDQVVSGSFLRTDANAFELRNDSALIKSSAGPETGVRYVATHSHEFFVGSDAAAAPNGSGAIEILNDKVVIRKDVDIVGSIDTIATDSTSLRLEDQIIRLAHSSDASTANRDAALQESKTGLVIDTVPASYDDDSEYMSRFRAEDGTKLFVYDDSETIDVSKARDSGLFAKEVAYHLNGGMKSAGARTPESRMNEPFWNISGGALHLSHTVPSSDGRATTYSLGFRVADNGTMEMIRLTKHLAWDAASGSYVKDSGSTDTSKVMIRFIDAPHSV